MARFDVYRNEGRSAKTTPYLIDVQSNIISGLATRIVIPLRSPDVFGSVTLPDDLFPMIFVLGEWYFLDTPQLAAIPSSELRNKVDSCRDFQFDIQAALDRAFGAH